MVKKRILILTFLSAALTLPAQVGVTIAVIPFTSSGLIGLNEPRIIETLVRAHVSELEGFELVSDPGSNNERPDYILSGSIRSNPEGLHLSLELWNTDTGERIADGTTFKNLGDTALGVSDMVARIAGDTIHRRLSRASEIPDELSEERVIGTWRGDRGIETVRLMRGGSGLAFFSSGVQMRLSYSIQDGVLSILQSSRNNERFYHPVPYLVARRLTEEARPMAWTFRLFDKGTALRGTKTATAVRYKEDTVLELIHGSMRGAEWTKITR